MNLGVERATPVARERNSVLRRYCFRPIFVVRAERFSKSLTVETELQMRFDEPIVTIPRWKRSARKNREYFVAGHRRPLRDIRQQMQV
jgi:hypothetical protein